MPAPDGGPDPLAREVAGEPGRVADQAEARAGEPPRRLAAHDVRVPLERLDRQPVGQPARGAQRGHQRVAPAGQAAVAARVQPMPILMKSRLGKYQP